MREIHGSTTSPDLFSLSFSINYINYIICNAISSEFFAFFFSHFKDDRKLSEKLFDGNEGTNYHQFRYFFMFLRNRKIRNPNVYIYEREVILHNFSVTWTRTGTSKDTLARNTRHGARTTGKLTGPSTVVAAYDQINGREKEREGEGGSISGMQILNELMKIKNTPGEGVRLISKTSCPPSPLYPWPRSRGFLAEAAIVSRYRFNGVNSNGPPTAKFQRL